MLHQSFPVSPIEGLLLRNLPNVVVIGNSCWLLRNSIFVRHSFPSDFFRVSHPFFVDGTLGSSQLRTVLCLNARLNRVSLGLKGEELWLYVDGVGGMNQFTPDAIEISLLRSLDLLTRAIPLVKEKLAVEGIDLTSGRVSSIRLDRVP